MKKKKRKDDEPTPETTEEQADVLDKETPAEASREEKPFGSISEVADDAPAVADDFLY